MSIICERQGVDVWELIKLANRHPRVEILQPGVGVGGHCIAVDPWFVVSSAPSEARLIRCAREVNDSKPVWVVAKIKESIQDYLAAHTDQSEADLTIACYGLAFKPNVDDLRESPAMQIVIDLAKQHPGKVLAVEPNISTIAGNSGEIKLVEFETAVACAQIHIVLVAHREFVDYNFPALCLRFVKQVN